jgi:N-acetylmuramoyl-L-alanine amidase
MMTQKIKPYMFCCLAVMVFLSKEGIADTELLAIDVGHSHARPGVISSTGIPEFEFNAALAGTVSDFLSAQGNPVIQIGSDGNMESLPKRTFIANEANAKFFLSIHHDSVQPKYLSDWIWQDEIRQYTDYAAGFSLFVSRKNPNLAASLQCATAIGMALKEKGLQPSPHHAENIAGENREWADRENGVYFYDDLIVLKTAAMPAVLLEAGVIVNREEEKNIQTPEMRNIIAAAIENGLRHCGVIN